MKTLKERLLHEVERLSPAELLAVQQLISSFKGGDAAPSSESSARRVRAALADLRGSLSDDVLQERDERI